MTIHNSDIAAMFQEMADLLEIEGANPFRARAYRDAAVTVEYLPQSAAEMVAQGADLTGLRGIGEDLADAIREIVETGEFSALNEVRERGTPSLRELTRIPGLGPKRVRTLNETLGIATLDDLAAALEEGKIRGIPGFGPKTVQNIRDAVVAGRRKKERRLLSTVEEPAEALQTFLCSLDGVIDGMVGGSYRRRRETVADLDAVASSSEPVAVIERFVEYQDIERIISQGDTRASVLLRSGLPVDLRVVAPESYGTAALYFTGARDHQIAMRDMAIERGWKLNEYGVWDGDQRVAGASEEEVYAAFGLAYIVPELRENRGELDAAARGELPTLIEAEDFRGDLHCHTSWTDGQASIEEMARAARERGYEYLAITDHSQRLTVANGLDADGLRRQAEEIDRLNDELDGITILKGIEVDILEDGSLDLPDDVLEALDVVICAVHSAFELPQQEQTERLLRAIEHPRCQILAHPLGRLINEREPLRIDLERVLWTARDAGCAIELNADPRRLDLPDHACRQARDIGAPIIIGSDAHSVEGLNNMRYGVWQARRGWLEAGDVINTRSLAGLREALRG